MLAQGGAARYSYTQFTLFAAPGGWGLHETNPRSLLPDVWRLVFRQSSHRCKVLFSNLSKAC